MYPYEKYLLWPKASIEGTHRNYADRILQPIPTSFIFQNVESGENYFYHVLMHAPFWT